MKKYVIGDDNPYDKPYITQTQKVSDLNSDKAPLTPLNEKNEANKNCLEEKTIEDKEEINMQEAEVIVNRKIDTIDNLNDKKLKKSFSNKELRNLIKSTKTDISIDMNNSLNDIGSQNKNDNIIKDRLSEISKDKKVKQASNQINKSNNLRKNANNRKEKSEKHEKLNEKTEKLASNKTSNSGNTKDSKTASDLNLRFKKISETFSGFKKGFSKKIHEIEAKIEQGNLLNKYKIDELVSQIKSHIPISFNLSNNNGSGQKESSSPSSSFFVKNQHSHNNSSSNQNYQSNIHTSNLKTPPVQNLIQSKESSHIKNNSYNIDEKATGKNTTHNNFYSHNYPLSSINSHSNTTYSVNPVNALNVNINPNINANVFTNVTNINVNSNPNSTNIDHYNNYNNNNFDLYGAPKNPDIVNYDKGKRESAENKLRNILYNEKIANEKVAM